MSVDQMQSVQGNDVRPSHRGPRRSALMIALSSAATLGVVGGAIFVANALERQSDSPVQAATGRPMSELNPKEVPQVATQLSLLLKGQKLEVAPTEPSVRNESGEPLKAAGEGRSTSAFSDAVGTDGHEYRVYVSLTEDGWKPSCESMADTISCNVTETDAGLILDATSVHTRLDSTGLYKPLEVPVDEADHSDLRLYRAVEFYSNAGVKVAATETVYGPRSEDLSSDLELSGDDLRATVTDPELLDILFQ